MGVLEQSETEIRYTHEKRQVWDRGKHICTFKINGHFGIHEFWTHPHHFCKYSLPGVLLVCRKKSENMNYSYSKGLHFLFYEPFCQIKGLEDTDVWSFSTSIFKKLSNQNICTEMSSFFLCMTIAHLYICIYIFLKSCLFASWDRKIWW